jgi:hypothetical protein
MTPRRSLLSDTRGAMYVEALILIPLFCLFWVLFLYLEDLNRTSVNTVQEARYCAWSWAVSRCQSPPPGCDLEAPRPIPDDEIQSAIGSELDYLSDEVKIDFPGFPSSVAPYLDHTLGSWIVATAEDSVERPFGTGSVEMSSTHAWTCQTPTFEPGEPWTWEHTISLPILFFGTCGGTDQTYCPAIN